MFEIVARNKKSRIGKIITKSGEISTPFFMPDATRGFVKSLSNLDLEKVGIGPMVVNTYHLYLNPGMELIKKAARLAPASTSLGGSTSSLRESRLGGIHKFMNWNGPLLSDSGGYQVFSLIHKNPKMGKITEDEVIFRSPLDGSKHIITPEKAIQIQFDLGVDMMVCLDDPPPNSYTKEKIKKAVERTLRWAKRCKIEYDEQIKKRKIKKEERPLLFGVIQGGEHLDLRKMCADGLVKIGFDGYGFGARHLDSEGHFLAEVLQYTAGLIPENSLRFALGVGTPEDIARCVAIGWDMFDCVIPTREGRHGRLFLWKRNPKSQIPNPKQIQNSKSKFYQTININNEKFKADFSPVDKNCDCELCRNYTKAYLRHLFVSKDPLGMRLASIHNLKFYMELMEKLRK